MSDKKLQNLEELIRTASVHLLSKEDKFAYISNPHLKKMLYGKYPECFISIKRLGQDTSSYLLPICNRAGIVDPDVIIVAMKAVKRLMADPSGTYDVNDLQGVLDKLNRIQNRYSKDVIKPPQQAGRKAVVTRMFNNVKDHLTTIRVGPKE